MAERDHAPSWQQPSLRLGPSNLCFQFQSFNSHWRDFTLPLSLSDLGVVGVSPKLFGTINVDMLLTIGSSVTTEEEAGMRGAAQKLHDLQMRGCILADGVGFGKTPQLLFVALLHSLLAADFHQGQRIHCSILLVVLSSLIAGWIDDIHGYWSEYFQLIVSYDDLNATHKCYSQGFRHDNHIPFVNEGPNHTYGALEFRRVGST